MGLHLTSEMLTGPRAEPRGLFQVAVVVCCRRNELPPAWRHETAQTYCPRPSGCPPGLGGEPVCAGCLPAGRPCGEAIFLPIQVVGRILFPVSWRPRSFCPCGYQLRVIRSLWRPLHSLASGPSSILRARGSGWSPYHLSVPCVSECGRERRLLLRTGV